MSDKNHSKPEGQSPSKSNLPTQGYPLENSPPPPSNQYPPPGQNLPAGQYPPSGQYSPASQYPPPVQYAPASQYPPPVQYAPAGQYPPPPPGIYQTTNLYQPPAQYSPPQVIWMPIPQVSNCPPGLEYLTQIDQLIIIQKVELLEVFTSFETKNKYRVVNSLGQQVYYAKEETDCLTRNCCGHLRQFNMLITDNTGREVIHLERPYACDSCCFPCCLQSIEITSPPRTTVVGSIKQEWTVLYPKFSVRNASGDTVLLIEGPFCTYGICGDVEFKVMSPDGTKQVGKISKQWGGLGREAFTDADVFGISFPLDLDVRVKAALLGAVFLIDFMFFETHGHNRNDSVGML